MKDIRQLFVGLLSAICTGLIVLAAGALAVMEGEVNTLPMSELIAETLVPTSTTAPGQPTMQPVTPSPTHIQFIQCNVPHGWQPYVIQPGDTLEIIAEAFQISADVIYEENCLSSTQLPSGSVLYLPVIAPTATVTATVTMTMTATFPPAVQPPRCGPPPGWVIYSVRPGDTIFRLSLALGISQYELVSANCLFGNTNIYVGQRLYVPFIPPVLPTATTRPTITPPTPMTETPVTPTEEISPTVPTLESPTVEPEIPTQEPPVATEIPPVETTEPASGGQIIETQPGTTSATE